MLLDEYTEFCDAISVIGDAGTALLGDVIDLGAVSRDIGNGEPLYFVINVDTEIVTAGSTGSIQFFLASDAQAAIATDGSATIHASSAALVTDDAAVNGVLCNAGAYPMYVAIPQGTTFERYIGVLCTIATQSVTAGKINAFLTTTPTGNPAYPDAL